MFHAHLNEDGDYSSAIQISPSGQAFFYKLLDEYEEQHGPTAFRQDIERMLEKAYRCGVAQATARFDIEDMEACRARTCKPDELEKLTAEGWRLTNIAKERYQVGGITYSTQEIHQGCTYTLQKAGEPYMFESVILILTRSRDVEFQVLRTELRNAGVLLNEQRMKLEEKSKELEQEKKVNEGSMLVRETLERDLKEQMSHTNEAQVRGEQVAESLHHSEMKNKDLRRMLNLLRAEIGNARFRELITCGNLLAKGSNRDDVPCTRLKDHEGPHWHSPKDDLL